MHKPKSFQENGTPKIFREFEILNKNQSVNLGQKMRPYVINKKKRTNDLVDFAAPAVH